MNRIVAVKLLGGLGNQMFQFAYGKQVSIKTGLPLKLDVSDLNENRKYELHIFNLDADLATKEEMLLFDRRNLTFTEKVIFKIKNGFSKPEYLLEKATEELEILPVKVNNNLLIKGHWQNEQYFKNIESTIRRDFLFPSIEDEVNRDIKKSIEQTNSVAIHIRRGDYQLEQNNKVHGILPLTYYNDAVQYMVRKISKPSFYIFSDDPEWVKSNLLINGKVYYVNGNEGSRAYVDMQLMSLCKHNIIANSSFSWWAAWLNDYRDKIVIAPHQWFVDPTKNRLHKDIIPKEWVKI